MTGNKTVVLISAEKAQFSHFSTLMRDEGYCVLASDDAIHGLKIAKADPPLLIIAELATPRVDGLEVCRRVRHDKNIRHVPIIVVGDLSRASSIVEDALFCGATDYFQKPFDQVALFECCAEVLGIESSGAAQQDPRESQARLQRQNSVLKELYKNQKIFGDSFDDAVREITRISAMTLETERASLWLYSDDRSRIEALDLYEMSKDIHSTTGILTGADFPAYFKFLRKGAPIVVSDAYSDRRTAEFISEYLPTNQITAMLDIPIRLAGKLVGVICFENVGQKREWTLDEQNFAGSMADLVALLLESKERRNAENALRYQKQIYESLIDSIEGIVWEADADPLNFSFVSKQAERLLGYPVDRWIDEPDFWASRLHPDDRDSIIDFCVKATERLEDHEFDYRIIAADGSVVWLHDIVTIDRSDADNIRLRGVMVDITENKLAEAALAEANQRAICEYVKLLERLATLGQQLGGARDLNSVFQSIIEFAKNSVPCSGLNISLCDKDQKLRQPIYFWCNDNEVESTALNATLFSDGPVGKTMEQGEILIFADYQNSLGTEPATLLIKDGSVGVQPQSAIVAPMKVMGEVIGVIELLSSERSAYTEEHATAMRMAANLTANAIENVRLIELEQRRAEQFRQSQQLESVGRLAGGIAHDFNNMLTAINGYSDLTLRKLPKNDPQGIRKNIEEIKKAGDRSAVLTQQLLAFSRRQVLKSKVIDINETVAETGTLLQRLIGEDIDLELSLSPALGAVRADPAILTQVIMNLAVNARDAMPDGGKLTIETSNQELDKEYAGRHARMNPGSYVMLAVSDTGAGMEDEVLEHLFEPFFTTKAVGKGTGLGLATVYGIVKQSGGYIWVYSEIGQGTIFKIYLPRVDAEADAITKGVSESMNLKGKETVFLVEDEEIVRKLSKQILESCGYTVVEARNGAEALELCKKSDKHFDLLLTDVVMPKMSGRQLVKHITGVRPGIKVLYMSGYTDDSVLRNGVIAAGENFIQKPFTFNTLAGQVREMLDS